jgi:O-antigen ligase
VKERFLSIFTRSLAYNPVYIRSIQWQCSFEILKTNAVVGVGTGDVQPYLQECYQAKAFWGHLARYNAHNDYFEEALRHGLLGLFIYLVSLFYPLYLSLKQHQYMYTAFLLLFMCCCMTESMLNTQKGAVYFAFFNSLFAFHLLKAPLPDRRGKQVSNDGLRKRNSFTK